MLTATLRALMQSGARCRSHEANQLIIHFWPNIIRTIHVSHVQRHASCQLTDHVAGVKRELPLTFNHFKIFFQ
jgi:hypothetical protein